MTSGQEFLDLGFGPIRQEFLDQGISTLLLTFSIEEEKNVSTQEKNGPHQLDKKLIV